MIGVPNWTNRERAERFGEYVELLDQLLAEGVTMYHGKFYEAKGAVMNPGLRAAAAPADHGRRARAADDALHGAARRHLEQL